MSCCSEDETQAAFGEISNNLLGLVDYFFTAISQNTSQGHLVACLVLILTTTGLIWLTLTKKREDRGANNQNGLWWWRKGWCHSSRDVLARVNQSWNRSRNPPAVLSGWSGTSKILTYELPNKTTTEPAAPTSCWRWTASTTFYISVTRWSSAGRRPGHGLR